MITSRSIHVTTNGIISFFLWLSDIPLHVRATLSLFLCLLAEIELLPCLSIVNSAARNTDGEGNGNPLQGSCLENSRDAGAWWAAVYRVAQSRTRLTRLSSSSSRNCGTGHLGSDPRIIPHYLCILGKITQSLCLSSVMCKMGIIVSTYFIGLLWRLN